MPLTEKDAFEQVMLELNKQEGFRVERETRGNIVTHTVFRDGVAIAEYRIQSDDLYYEGYPAAKGGERDAAQREEDRELLRHIQQRVERQLDRGRGSQVQTMAR